MKMNNQVVNTEDRKVTEKDLKRVYKRWLFTSQLGWNYERMQGLGYTYTMMPLLRKFYKKPEELKEMVKVHMQFFNTHPHVAPIVLGADIAIEENKGIEGKEAVLGIKTGLMGPLAGIGDTLNGVIAKSVFGGIAGSLALGLKSGGALMLPLVGIFLYTSYNFFAWWLRWVFLKLGYKEGVKLVSNLSGKLKYITEAANVLGVTVIGAMIPLTVRIGTKYSYKIGEKVTNVQTDFIDKLMPALIPALMVGLIYWLLGKKKMSSTKAILVVIVIGVIFGGLFPILG
ncbi:PTS system IID component, Man family [Clostridium amylolyticum]|uniref:PTS system IID component, Man family n=1 Tax=Clostridium amylolyticum TaxID=1121298 RepID=A0A1M6NTC5_9CLOT|nr:PTS system mannose/fructose/sorbose family transporter subunit IID [Clostridium amylolyticum]SHJ98904.1 PTS system IID component, Man family [Clostridium amylolyticum]